MEKISFFFVNKLWDFLQGCFQLRRNRVPVMDELLVKFYFAAMIKIIRNIHEMCRAINPMSNREELLAIARVVSDELAPTAAYANCYDRAIVAAEFGDEMNNEIEKLLDECWRIDCNAAAGARVPVVQSTIEPICMKIEVLWKNIIEIYCKKVCILGFVHRAIKKKMIEYLIKKSVPRSIQYSINGAIGDGR
ncbi:MAG: hypothetical protein J6R28_07905 [Bacteroides sp.]|nr:hypothetical protein [Bacteroides sp.]